MKEGIGPGQSEHQLDMTVVTEYEAGLLRFGKIEKNDMEDDDES
jgi:hypothetical protein